MKNNFFEQYKNGNLKEETKKNLDKLKKAVNEFNSRAKFVDKLTPDEREKINNELFYYLAKQSDKLPDFKGILSEQEIEDLKKIIAALREAGVSFKLENEKGVRRLKISVDLLSISLLVGSIVTFPVFGPIGLIIGAATAVVSEVGNIAVNKRLKSTIESNKTVGKVANEIGFDFSESLNDRLKINETKIEIKKEEAAKPLNSLKKSIVVQDITKSDAELIVNAGYEGRGKGVDGAIFKAFNKDGSLEKAVKEAIKKLGHEPVIGDVMLTEVNSKKIIHTVPPDFVNRHPLEAKTKLVTLYFNILSQIRASGVKSAVIPLICAGSFGAPLEWAFECFMLAYEDESLPGVKLDFCFYGNVKTLDGKTVSAKKAVDIAKKMIDERIDRMNKAIDNYHDEEKNEIDGDDYDDPESEYDFDPKDIVLENYIESENSDEKNSFNKNGLTINKEQVVGILEKKYEKLLKEIKPDIDYKQTRYESILKLGRVVEAIRNNQAFDTNDFVATIDRLRNSINDVDEKDFGDAAKIKQIALYLINKEIADKSKLAAKAKNISENKIKKGDLLKQDKNVTLLDPGYNGDTDSVDGFIFDKLGLERNSKLQKEMQDQEIDAKFVENEKGSTVLTKIDFGSFEPTENNLSEVYYQAFKECNGRTETLACPLVGDGSLKAEIKTVVNGAVKGVEKFINENPNSKLDIKYIIYEKDKDADKKVENMKNGFKGLANKYEQEVSKAKNELDKILNLEIKTQAKQIKINPTKIIKKPSVKALTLIKNKAKTKISDNKNKKTETDKNNDLIK